MTVTFNQAQSVNATHYNSSVADYISLLKPRVMSLVIFSGIAGLIAAPGSIHPLLGVVAILCLAIGAGSAGAMNMWMDRDIDALMTRTQTRPIPAGRIHPDDALGFAITLNLLSTMIMGLAVNWWASGLLAFATFFYVVIYTGYLKRSTPQNIVIGGAAGAFPPVIGWIAVTGSPFMVEPWILFAIIFLWTPPHFWALALISNEDYKRANIPMLPLTHGDAVTRWQMLAYTLVLLPVSLLPSLIGGAGDLYLWAATILGSLFTLSAVQVLRLKTNKSSGLMFGYSIFYLFALFTFLIIDRVL